MAGLRYLGNLDGAPHVTARERKAPSEEARNRVALRSCRRILKTVVSARTRLSPKLDEHPDGDVIDGLMDKAVKTARSISLLTSRNYPEDALILARSLANLAIDLAYLSAKDDDRVVTYRASGRLARKQMAEQCNFPPPDADAPDWAEVKKRADQWKKRGAIYQRAAKGNQLRLYEYAYRHGSSFEHSDAWSLMTYDPENKWARGVIMHLALLVTSYSLSEAMKSWAQFFGIDNTHTAEAIGRHFFAAFPAPKPEQTAGC